MDYDKYKNKLPFGSYGSPERLAYNHEAARLSVLFQLDALREAGLEGHPLAEALFGFAYEHGHAEGHSVVFDLLCELSERLVSKGASGQVAPSPAPAFPCKDGRFIFRDRFNILCSVELSPFQEDQTLRIGISSRRMCLSRETVAGLIPLLQHFVDTGKLPD
jgi:hypothetical protein